MKRPKVATIIVIIALIGIGLYVAGEVNYFSKKMITEEKIESPVVNIPSIGVHEKINNVSISNGVYHEELSYKPTKGDVVLFGHRTLQGSPFLRLNELKSGDIVNLQWPGIGEVNYTIKNSYIVPGSYKLSPSSDSQKIYLITCDPIGSTANRLICEGELKESGPLNDKIINENPQKHYALIIIIGFLVIGLLISYFYSRDNRIYLLITVFLITAILIYFYINPIPSEIIYSKISLLNGDFTKYY